MPRAYSQSEANAELWRRGEIEELLFHEGQLFINEMVNRLTSLFIVLNISRQWGKTFFSVVKAIALALKKRNARIRIGAAFEADLTEFIEPAFEIALATCPARYRPRYIQHKKRYLFKNGSTIKLVGLDRRPNGLRGNSIDMVVIDEAGFVSRLKYLFESVIIPLFTHRPDAIVMFISTPPESPDHEFWEFADQAKLDNAYAEFTIDQNPLLTPDDIARIEKSMGGRHTTAFRREYLCERIIEEEKAIIPEWSPRYEVDTDFKKDPLYQFYLKHQAMDMGVQRDKTVDIFGFYNFKEGVLFIEDEIDISGAKTTTDLIFLNITHKEKEIGYETTYRRVADNSHPLLLNDLATRGLAFAATDKAKLHEMVGELRVWVKMGRVRVHKRCKQVIGCLRSGIWNEKRTEFERSKVFGHYDALAALIYLVRNVDQWTNPIPDYVNNPGRWPGQKSSQGLSPLGNDLKGLFSTLPKQ